MTVNSVNDYSSFNTVAKSTAIGVTAGYALKYVWPVNKQEYSVSPRKFVNLSRKVVNDSKILEFENSPQKTPAQDCFEKLAKSKDKKAFTQPNIAKLVEKLGGEKSAAGNELKNIIKDTNKAAKKMTKQLIIAYNLMLKHKRPVVPFLVAGAGAGFISGIIKNVVRNDV